MAEQVVLIVDDDVATRHCVVLQMDKLGIQADSAANGIEAFKRAQNFSYGLILMDLQMPDMNGLLAAAAIRLHEKNNDLSPVPIIAFTAGDLNVSQAECLEAGINECIEKPLTLDHLRRVISQWLQPQLGLEER